MKDTLPRTQPYAKERAIVNLDSYRNQGTHWCAYRKNKSKVFWFDSFGAIPPPKEIVSYFRGNDIIYNHDAFQTYNSFLCGHLCLLFLLLSEEDL